MAESTKMKNQGKKSGVGDALKELAASWGDVEESAGFEIPDGKYTVQVKSATLNKSKSSGRLQVSWDLVIADGDYRGRHLFSHNGIEDATGLGFLRGILARLGLDWPSSPEELPEILEQSTDMFAQVTVKTKERNGSEFQNTYFTRGLPDYEPESSTDEEEPEPAPAPAPKSSKAAPAPAPAPTSKPKASTPRIEPTIEEGMSVEVDYDGTIYRGVVSASDADEKMATVGFEDGSEDTLSWDSLKIVPAKSKPAKASKAAPVEEAETEAETEAEGVEIEFGDDDFNPIMEKKLHRLAGVAELEVGSYESNADMIVDLAEACGLTGKFDDVKKLLAAIEKEIGG